MLHPGRARHARLNGCAHHHSALLTRHLWVSENGGTLFVAPFQGILLYLWYNKGYDYVGKYQSRFDVLEAALSTGLQLFPASPSC